MKTGSRDEPFGYQVVRRARGFPWARPKPAPEPEPGPGPEPEPEPEPEREWAEEEKAASWPAADRSGSWRIVPDPSAHVDLTSGGARHAAPAVEEEVEQRDEEQDDGTAPVGPTPRSVESEVAAVTESVAAHRAAEKAQESATSFENLAASWVPPWARQETQRSAEDVATPQEREVGRFAYGDSDDLPNPDTFLPDLGEERLRGALEAIMLVVDNPVTSVVLAQVLEEPTARIDATLEAMATDYSRGGRGIDLRRVAGGWRFYTRSEYASYVERFVLDGQQIRLTQAALETLAVIAYKQPVTRSRVSAVRGVNCDGVIKTLVTRGLVEECGTERDGAHLYRTTQLFLEKLGLNSVEDLPSLAQYLPENLDEIEIAQR